MLFYKIYSSYYVSIVWFCVFQITVLSTILNAQPLLVLESEVVDFIFPSNTNGSILRHNEYHISINIPSAQASYTMHLSKPQDLFNPENIGIQPKEVDHYNCLYTGTLTSSDGKDVGRASLSSCFYENGFEGLVYLENEHYHITPYHTSNKRRRSKRFSNNVSKHGSKSKATIRHKIAKPKTDSTQKHRSDSKRVPDEELKKARQQMLKDQESLDDERDEDDDSEEKDDDNSMDDSTFILERNDPTDSNENIDEIEMVLGIRTKTKTTGKRKSKKIIKKKLARVIELAIFTDEAFYREWSAMHPTDTVKKINQYLLALVNNMNLMYQQPSMGPKISFRLVNVGIQKTTPIGLQPTETAENYLDSFCVFAGKKDKNGAIWDHAMMISGLELKDKMGGDNLGIAFTSTMCLRYWSCSLVEYNKGFETTFTAAHELGHSLGMEHDGEDMNKKCNPSKFIMAAIAGSGQINWSPCLNQNVKNFVASGDPRAKVKDPSSVPRCLTKRGSKRSGIRYKTGQFPGKIFNVKRQCIQACKDCTPYVKNEAPYNNVCKELYCQTSTKEIIHVHPALEGTACGQGAQAENMQKWTMPIKNACTKKRKVMLPKCFDG